ncbi:cytochrome P450 [Nocardia sp. NPDC006044]|uniref:cytochrome P450 n=1 Tax=Nocardia sp. NPDC006044 TaxID=3364306 RepID=UPI0036855003
MTSLTEVVPLPDVVSMPQPLGPNGQEPPLYARLRRERPVARVAFPSGVQAWMLTKHADITAIATDKRFSRNFTDPSVPRFAGENFNTVVGGIFNLDPPEHGRIRHVVAPFFAPAAAAALQPRIAAHAERLITQMESARAASGSPVIDLLAHYGMPLGLNMACELMGVPMRQRVRIVPDLLVQANWGEESIIINASTDRLMAFTDEVITAVRTEGGAPDADPIRALIHAHTEGKISAQELRATTMYLFLTSAEPVAGPTAVGVYTLLGHRNMLQQLLARDTDDDWDRAVWELLRRHHNGTMSVPRLALEDVELHGVVIRKGESVVTPWIAASCDPERFKTPAEYLLNRSEQEDPRVSFGHGPHFCLGSHIARMHLRTALRTLWRRIPTLMLAVRPEDIAWEPPEVLFARPVELPVTW